MLEGMLSAMTATVDMMVNYETRKLGRIERNGLILSTCYTSDMGYETAIIDADRVYPVERYSSKENAEKGHDKWDKKLDTLTEITELDYYEIDPKSRVLRRFIQEEEKKPIAKGKENDKRKPTPRKRSKKVI